MAPSTSSHKRRCYFTPQGLSSMWCHCSQWNPANQSSPISQQLPSLPLSPPICLKHKAKHQWSLLKKQCAGFQLAKCKTLLFYIIHTRWWHMLTIVTCCNNVHLEKKLKISFHLWIATGFLLLWVKRWWLGFMTCDANIIQSFKCVWVEKTKQNTNSLFLWCSISVSESSNSG